MFKPSSKIGFFITGTDTNVGKTTVACHLLNLLKQSGYTTAALKPIASGCEFSPQGFINQDALQLQAAATLTLPYQFVNPIALPDPIAPHLAAQKSNLTLSVEKILAACQPILQCNYEVLIVEGAGGWLVPLNERETMADLAIALGFPILFIVGIRLGCINHALLTQKSLLQNKALISGWIANLLTIETETDKLIIETLKKKLVMPYYGCMDFVKPFSHT